MRWHQGRLLVTFAELADRNAAEAARGLVLVAEVPEDEVPEDPEEFYDHQLVGLRGGHHRRRRRRRGRLGRARRRAGPARRSRAADGREILVPFVTALVPEVDLAGRRVVVADRPGLLTPLDDEEQG